MRRLASALLGTWLTGCAMITTPPPAPPGIEAPERWEQRRATLERLDRWALQGRVATGKVLGWSGNLSWRQNGESFSVRLSGPLGAGGFRARGTPALVEVHTKEETYHTRDPEALATELVGWEFPLRGLRYWAIGLPDPASEPDSVSVDERGLLIGLEQAGWRLAYPEYRAAADVKLPRKIVLDNGENTIQLVIDRWFDLQLSGATSATQN